MFRYLFLFYVIYVCLCEFICATCVQDPAEARRGVKSPGTGITAVGSCHTDAGNPAWVLSSLLCLGDKVLLSSLGWPETRCVDQAGLELTLPAAAS